MTSSLTIIPNTVPSSGPPPLILSSANSAAFVTLLTGQNTRWLALDPTAVTSDTPVPFDIRPIWLQLDSENRETRAKKADPSTACLVAAGDAAALRSAQFKPYG